MLALVLNHPIQLPVVALTLLAGSVIPAITAAVTNAKTSARVKSIVNAGLAAIAGAVTAAIATKGNVVPSDVLLGVATAFIASVSSYKGLLNPVGIVDAISTAVPGGIGKDATSK